MLKQAGLRSPQCQFHRAGSGRRFYTQFARRRGDLVMGRVRKSSPTRSESRFKGQTITLLGFVEAPGGTISIAGGGKIRGLAAEAAVATRALPTVVLVRVHVLDRGTAVFLPDALGASGHALSRRDDFRFRQHRRERRACSTSRERRRFSMSSHFARRDGERPMSAQQRL